METNDTNSALTAEILSIGTELLLGEIVNTNAAYVAARLSEIGVCVYRQIVVGDNRSRLREAFSTALERSDLVIATGGLGPTYDDITKEVLAEVMNVPLVLDQEAMRRIEGFFAATHLTYTKNNEKQALVPEGSVVFQNENGSAPGFAVQDAQGKTAILLPGPPLEMEPMFSNQVIPYLLERSNQTILSRTLRIFGIGESQVEDLLRTQMEEGTNPTIAPYAKRGEVELRVTARGRDTATCMELVQPVVEDIEQLLAPYVYGVDVPNMQTELVRRLKSRHMTLATAESCTGGLLSERVTQISGSSEVFGCGVCSYANEIKERVLGVRRDTLEKFGAVSKQTAIEMALGVKRLAGSDAALSTTGIAGPTGGTPEKPVGTVYVGIVVGHCVRVLELHLRSREKDERDRIRHLTALNAFSALLNMLRE